ncbi:hypothetical protein JYK00_07545 [Thermosipho ferrireducens]|uniref:Uncharacterized protein n=1 Tax=Thermosipho ferrireducens TaxID=2571116 RepID=A0ABX7S8G8_9BACT|nr:hypothetical protein [Thermosipho ferrireducens]QTA37578.1 hypothetical protein JYK00_07545 [Thermosipho ferrireducens]
MKKFFLLVLLMLLVLNIYAVPKVVSGTVLENDDLKIVISFKNSMWVGNILNTIQLDITNKTDKTIKILLQESVFTDNRNSLTYLINSQTRVMNVGKDNRPLIIPPNSHITYEVVPDSHLHYSTNLGWYLEAITAFPSNRTLLITYEIEGQKRDISTVIRLEDSNSGNLTNIILMIGLILLIGAVTIGFGS